jgi:hypothetical protein
MTLIRNRCKTRYSLPKRSSRGWALPASGGWRALLPYHRNDACCRSRRVTFLELVVGVVVWLVDRLAAQSYRSQTDWSGQALQAASPSQPHPTRPGLTDSTAHNFTLTVTARHRLPHTHTRTVAHTQSHVLLHVGQQGVRQTFLTHR